MFISDDSTASDNEIHVFGNTDLSQATVEGGRAATVTGNKLVFGNDEGMAWTPANYTIPAVRYFSTIQFKAATWGKTIIIDKFRGDGDGRGQTKVDAKPTKMKGTRGYGEIGVSVKPAAATGWQFDFSLNGLAGSRYRGAWAKAEAKYMF